MTELPDLPDLRELRSGVSGQPAYRDAREEADERRRQRQQLPLAAATELAHDAAMAYRDVLGPREQRDEPAEGRGSTFL